jgi:hypothetical protein
MSSKRKFPGIEEEKENPSAKPLKKMNQGPNLFSFFKSTNPKTPKKTLIVEKNENGNTKPPKTKEKPANNQQITLEKMMEPKPMIDLTPKKRKNSFSDKNNKIEQEQDKLMDFRKLKLPDFLSTKKATYKSMEMSDQINEDPKQNVLSKTFWSAGVYSQSFPYFLVSESLDAVSKQKGENSVQNKKDILANLFTETIKQSPSELFVLYNFLTCRFDADFRQKDINIGNETILKVISTLSGKTLKFIRGELKKIGDLGTLSELSREGQKTISTFFISKKTKDINMKVTLYHCFDELRKFGEISNLLMLNS